MRSDPKVDWTCDRCGDSKSVKVSDQPAGWVGLLVVAPPEASWEKAVRKHLCESCTRDFRKKFMPFQEARNVVATDS